MTFDNEYLLKETYEAEATLLDKIPKNSDNSEAFRCLDAAIEKLKTGDLEGAITFYETGFNTLLKIYRGSSLESNQALVELCLCLGSQYAALAKSKIGNRKYFDMTSEKRTELNLLCSELNLENSKFIRKRSKDFDAEKHQSNILCK